MNDAILDEFTVKVSKIHLAPDIILYRNLVTPEECDYLISKVKPFLKRSRTFGSKEDTRRTSHSAYCSELGVNRVSDPIVMQIKTRCSALCGYPMNYVEIPQIVRYFPGQKFLRHTDNYLEGDPTLNVSGQRDFTFFIYLNDEEDYDQRMDAKEFFGPNQPQDSASNLEVEKLDNLSAVFEGYNPHRRGGSTYFSDLKLHVKPEKGMGVFWRNIHMGNKVDDTRHHHEGIPPKDWTKYGMNIWVRARPVYGNM